MKVGACRHMDDTTQVVWRHVMFFCCVITSEEGFAIDLNCVGFGCNTVYPWDSIRVLLTQTLHPPPIGIVVSRWWVNLVFSVNCPFKFSTEWMDGRTEELWSEITALATTRSSHLSQWSQWSRLESRLCGTEAGWRRWHHWTLHRLKTESPELSGDGSDWPQPPSGDLEYTKIT